MKYGNIVFSVLQIMDIIFIKEEKEDSDSSVPSNSTSTSMFSPATSYNSFTTSTNTISYPPTQRVLPSNQSARQGVSVNTEETELLDKVKKLLWLMIIFGENISAAAGAIVKRNATSLLVSRDKECLNIFFLCRWDPFLWQSSSVSCSWSQPFLSGLLCSHSYREIFTGLGRK